MKHALTAGLACLMLAGCATASLAPPPPPPPPPSAAAAAAVTGTPWQAFAQKSVDAWFEQDPSFAVYQGAHRYDGRLPDWSAAGLSRRIAFLRGLMRDAGAFTGLSPADAFERDYLVMVARRELFWIAPDGADQPHTNLSWYVNGGLDPNVYVSREYADKPTRMRALIAFFGRVPQAASDIRANLTTPMPASFVKYGIAGFGGFADYYRNDVPRAFADVDDPALQAQLKQSADTAAQAMDGLTAWLRTQQGTATQGFALGPVKFAQMLRDTEGVDVPLDELERIGRADLQRNQVALKQACTAYAPGVSIAECYAKSNADKPDEGPVEAARRQIPELTAFVRAHDIVTIPGTEQALVRPSPPYNAQNSAYIDPPGPYEKGIPSIYYIAPPDPAWSKEKQLEYIPGKYDLLFTSVHEVMPGHFLQFLHSNRSPSLIGRLFVGYAFAEGWAHYAEEMMYEEGYGSTGGAPDPGVHIGQLSNALLRDCRYLSAIGLHARGMTQAQSQALFRDQCYQGEGTADQQAARGTYDPAYLNYTMGKLMIRKLRADWTASRGGKAAWKSFHDTFLGFGGPPIPLVREAMMGEDAPHAVF